MMQYSTEPRDQIFVKGYIFSSFTKNMSKNHQQSATDALKTASKRTTQKTTEATCNLIVIKLWKKLLKIHRKIIQILTHKQNKSIEIPKIYLFIYLSIYLSLYLSIYLSTYTYIYIYINIYIYISRKKSNFRWSKINLII